MNFKVFESLIENSSTSWMKPLLTQMKFAYSHGYEITASGALAICPRKAEVPGESHWLHVVLPGISKNLLNSIELDLGFRNNDPSIDVLTLGLAYVTGGYDFDHYVPEEIKELLLVTNGLGLFGGHLCIWGVQTQPASLKNKFYSDVKMRDGEMTSYNIWNRPKYLKPKILVFGVYPSNGSILYMREGDSSVYNADRNGKEQYKVWSSLGEWLQSEIRRLSLLFDEKGTLKVHFSQTHPSFLGDRSN